MLTQKEVEHIATLAKIELKEGEAQKFAGQLSSILDHFASLQEVDTKNVPETSQVTGLTNCLRPDEVKSSKIEDDLLNCSPFPTENHSIKIPKMM